MIKICHCPCQLVAIKDDVSRGAVLASFGLPDFTNDWSFLGAVAYDDIVLVDVDIRELCNWNSIDCELDISSGGVETRAFLELSLRCVLKLVSSVCTKKMKAWTIAIAAGKIELSNVTAQL